MPEKFERNLLVAKSLGSGDAPITVDQFLGQQNHEFITPGNHTGLPQPYNTQNPEHTTTTIETKNLSHPFLDHTLLQTSLNQTQLSHTAQGIKLMTKSLNLHHPVTEGIAEMKRHTQFSKQMQPYTRDPLGIISQDGVVLGPPVSEVRTRNVLQEVGAYEFIENDGDLYDTYLPGSVPNLRSLPDLPDPDMYKHEQLQHEPPPIQHMIKPSSTPQPKSKSELEFEYKKFIQQERLLLESALLGYPAYQDSQDQTRGRRQKRQFEKWMDQEQKVIQMQDEVEQMQRKEQELEVEKIELMKSSPAQSSKKGAGALKGNLQKLETKQTDLDSINQSKIISQSAHSHAGNDKSLEGLTTQEQKDLAEMAKHAILMGVNTKFKKHNTPKAQQKQHLMMKELVKHIAKNEYYHNPKGDPAKKQGWKEKIAKGKMDLRPLLRYNRKKIHQRKIIKEKLDKELFDYVQKQRRKRYKKLTTKDFTIQPGEYSPLSVSSVSEESDEGEESEYDETTHQSLAKIPVHLRRQGNFLANMPGNRRTSKVDKYSLSKQGSVKFKDGEVRGNKRLSRVDNVKIKKVGGRYQSFAVGNGKKNNSIPELTNWTPKKLSNSRTRAKEYLKQETLKQQKSFKSQKSIKTSAQAKPPIPQRRNAIVERKQTKLELVEEHSEPSWSQEQSSSLSESVIEEPKSRNQNAKKVVSFHTSKEDELHSSLISPSKPPFSKKTETMAMQLNRQRENAKEQRKREEEQEQQEIKENINKKILKRMKTKNMKREKMTKRALKMNNYS